MADSSDSNVLSAILNRLSAIEERGKKQSRKLNGEIKALKKERAEAAEEAAKAAKGQAPETKRATEQPSEAGQSKVAAASEKSAPESAFEKKLAQLSPESRVKLDKAIAEDPALKEAFSAAGFHVARPGSDAPAVPGAGQAQEAGAGGGRGPGPARVPSIGRPRSQVEFAQLPKEQRVALMADSSFALDELPRALRE